MLIVEILILIMLVIIMMALNAINDSIQEFIGKNQFNHNRLYENELNSGIFMGEKLANIENEIVKEKKYNYHD